MLLSILEPQARLKVMGGALHVQQGGLLRNIPLHRIQAVQLWSGATLSGPARALLVRAHIPVTFLDRDGRCVGRLTSPLSRSGQRRMEQLAGCMDEGTRCDIARAVVNAKIENQHAMLTSRQARLKDARLWKPLALLTSLRLRLPKTHQVPSIRGLEGSAARHYFEAMGVLLAREDVVFSGRSRRPPRDPVNATLSLAYTLLTIRCIGAAEVAGLDPYVGVLHDATRGQPAFALDLAEVFRPLIDRLVLTMFNRRQLSPKDFRHPTAEELGAKTVRPGEPPAVYMGRSGKRALITAWDALLQTPMRDPVSSNMFPLIELIPRQAMHLGQAICRRQSEVQLFKL